MINTLSKSERTRLELEALYESYGFGKYAMRKFEEYSLYLENKNFLTSEYILTFNDPGGRLMALKPDVTLSILKNAKNSRVTIKHKVDDMDTPEEFKGTKFYAGFIQFKNMRDRVRVFNDVTHFTIGCSGDMFKDGGNIWCTNDWIIKLSETIPEDVLKKYNK